MTEEERETLYQRWARKNPPPVEADEIDQAEDSIIKRIAYATAALVIILVIVGLLAGLLCTSGCASSSCRSCITHGKAVEDLRHE